MNRGEMFPSFSLYQNTNFQYTLFDKHGHISTIFWRIARLSDIGRKTTKHLLAAVRFQCCTLRSLDHHIWVDQFHGSMAT
jgi:hypothetical protein